MKPLTWTNGKARIGDLVDYDKNPVQLSERAAKELAKSLKKFGHIIPYTAAAPKNGSKVPILDGHQRKNVEMALLGVSADTMVEVRFPDRKLTEKERQEAIIRLRKNTGEWDFEKLANFFDTPDLLDWGFSEKELLGAGFEFEDTTQDAEPQLDRAAELLEKWKVCTGDLFAIGEHRLLCGDSTKREDVERVMGGERADMVFEDPPYNVSSEGRNYAADAPTQKKTYEAIKEAEWDKNFDITPHLDLLLEFMEKDVAIYICTSQWLVQQIWEWMLEWSDYCSYCVWVKPNPAPSLAKRHWTWATELIPYAVRGKHVCNFPDSGHALNWWEVVSGTHTEDHPTQKPIEIPSRAIGFSSKEGVVIFDGFLGSGTTLVACENLQRRGRGIEISPAYVAVTLERMATAFPHLKIERVKV